MKYLILAILFIGCGSQDAPPRDYNDTGVEKDFKNGNGVRISYYSDSNYLYTSADILENGNVVRNIESGQFSVKYNNLVFIIDEMITYGKHYHKNVYLQQSNYNPTPYTEPKQIKIIR